METFEEKNSLLKPVPAKRIIAFPQWTKYSIAAGVALIVFVSLFKYLDSRNNTPQIVKTDSVNNQVVPPVVTNNTAGQILPSLSLERGYLTKVFDQSDT